MSQPQSAVNVPAVGPVRRQWLFVGAAVVAVVVGYAYYKRSRSGASTTTYDPSQGTVDLGTGGYQNPAPTSPPSGPIDDPNTISSNDEWAQLAVARLVEAGYNAQYAAVTIGKYLAGQQLDENELDLIRAAFALAGQPPQYLAPVSRPTTTQPLPTPDPTPAPTPTPTPVARPASLTAPANTNLYDWSQATENQYNIHEYQIIDRCSETGKMKWGRTSDPNGYPYFAEPTAVRLG